MAKSKASDIKAGGAYVAIWSEDSALIRGLQRSEKRVEKWAANVAGIGTKVFAAGAAGLTFAAGAAAVFTSTGDSLAKMSARTGVSVESLSELQFSAGQSGTSIETLEGSLRKMQKVLADPSAKTTQDALAAVGVTAAELSGLSTEDKFYRLADGLASIPDPSKRAAAAMEIFGKSGTALLPMLANGSAGVRALNQQARDLGLTMSGVDAKNAEKLGDAIDVLKSTSTQGIVSIGAALAPDLIDAADALKAVTVGTSRWIEQNREAVRLAAAVALGVTGVGAAILATSGIMFGASKAIGFVAGSVKAFGAVVGLVTSPIGLAGAAVVGLMALVEYHTGIGSAALDRFKARWPALKDDVTSGMDAARAALAQGNLGQAADILWQTVKVAWATGIDALAEPWNKLKADAQFWYQDLGIQMASGAEEGWLNVQIAWETGLNTLTETLAQWWVKTAALWDRSSNFLAKGMIRVQAALDPDLTVEDLQQSLDEELQGRLEVRAKEAAGSTISRATEFEARIRELTDERERVKKAYADATTDALQQADAAEQAGTTAAAERLQAEREKLQKAIAAVSRPTPSPSPSPGSDGEDEDGSTPPPKAPEKKQRDRLQAGSDAFAAQLSAATTIVQTDRAEDPMKKKLEGLQQLLKTGEQAWDRWGGRAKKNLTEAAKAVAPGLLAAVLPTGLGTLAAGTLPSLTQAFSAQPAAAKTDAEPAPTEPDRRAGFARRPDQPTPEPVQPATVQTATMSPKALSGTSVFKAPEPVQPAAKPDRVARQRAVAERQADLAAQADAALNRRRLQQELSSPLPQRPNFADTIGRAKAIADQVRALKPGEALNTNQGNVADIVAFADANRRFEQRAGRAPSPQLPVIQPPPLRVPSLPTPTIQTSPVVSTQQQSSREVAAGLDRMLRVLGDIKTNTAEAARQKPPQNWRRG